VAKLSLSNIGTLVKDRRGSKGIREVAKEVGISSATLSRIENGKLPDIDTFSKICKWLNIDPAEILGCKSITQNSPAVDTSTMAVHFKADKNLDVETMQSLTHMIMKARQMIAERLK
jgi:transcriptional regulator with XRE-family HTH domain